MKNTISVLLIVILLQACNNQEPQTGTKIPTDGPIQLHPENPHYFLYKGKFHYAWHEAVEWNYHFDKVIGFDESGFAGSNIKYYNRFI